jgi:hypothetical protein
LRCFDFYFDIIQIKYTSFLANDVYLILLFMSRYNHAAFKQTTYIIFENFLAHSEKCMSIIGRLPFFKYNIGRYNDLYYIF